MSRVLRVYNSRNIVLCMYIVYTYFILNICVCVCDDCISERVYVRTHRLRPFIPIRVYLRLQTQYICL